MNVKLRYQSTFRKLSTKGITMDVQWEKDRLRIGSILLSATPAAKIDTLRPDEGVLLRHTHDSFRNLLRNKGVSYVDTDGNIFLNMLNQRIILEQTKIKKRIATAPTDVQSPSNIVSPNGLAFVEALLWTDEKKLARYRSTLQFCQTFRLYQPKASQIMRSMKASSLTELRRKIKVLPIHWWQYAMEAPVTKRQMTSFYSIGQSYYSLDDKFEFDQQLKEMMKKYPFELCMGPAEVAKTYGTLIDESLELWVSSNLTQTLKKTFRLVAGRKDGHRSWRLATPTRTLQKEGIFSHVQKVALHSQSNVLRSIWDMGFGDLRMRDARDRILEKVLHEV